MASTGAVVYLRPRISAAATANHSSGAVVFLSVRAVSGLWRASDITASANLGNLRTWLPHSNVPIGYVNGDRSKPVMIDVQAWYSFLNYLVNTVLGGPSAPTLADVTTAVVTAAEQSAASASVVTAVAQQTQANAESLAAVVQVAQDNSLPGSENIPPVQQGYHEF